MSEQPLYESVTINEYVPVAKPFMFTVSLFTFVTTEEKVEFVDVIMLSIEPSVFWGQLVFEVIKLSIKKLLQL